MFYGCSSLTSLDLSPLDTSNVTDMGYMFQGSSSLTSLDLSSFDTSNVTSMGYMFQSCSSLTSLDLSGFDTTQVLSMSRMFSGCKSLREVALGERFSFEGAGSRRLCELPAIDARDVPGADGLWHDGAGRSFAPADVPSRTAATYSSVAPARSPFSDVTPSTPHAAHILWLAGEGISTGFPDGTFRPLATVKRCDMAAFLHRMEPLV